jgi:predicted RNA-binding protein YlxR (DUF448 family)
VTVDKDGTLVVGHGLGGRGAWLCAASTSCMDLAARRKAFARALKTEFRADQLAALRSHLSQRGTMVEAKESNGGLHMTGSA